MCHPFPESFKDFLIKSLIDRLSWWHKFLVEDPLTVRKTNEHHLILDVLILAFLGRGEFACATPDFGILSRGHTLKSMIHHL
jgi:hypothetical protein